LARSFLNPVKPYNLRFECALKHGIGFSILTAIILTLIDVLVLMGIPRPGISLPFFNWFSKRKIPMGKVYYCKYCGDSHAVLLFLTSGVCSKSPNRRHQLYAGSRRGYEGCDEKGRYRRRNLYYYCRYCGDYHVTIAELTKKPCAKSPTGYHQPYEGEDKPKYVCKYCGISSRSIENLTRGSCSASPNRHHQPVE
jgi:hypothetical protein